MEGQARVQSRTGYKRKNTRKIGSFYERQAEEFLKAQGYEILERNFRCRLGEVDLIAFEKERLVFVEVKYRKDGTFGTPADAVDRRKQRRISNVAAYYLYTHSRYADAACRFDVMDMAGDKITLYRDAFYYCGDFR